MKAARIERVVEKKEVEIDLLENVVYELDDDGSSNAYKIIPRFNDFNGKQEVYYYDIEYICFSVQGIEYKKTTVTVYDLLNHYTSLPVWVKNIEYLLLNGSPEYSGAKNKFKELKRDLYQYLIKE